MEELQDAIEDAQYVSAIASVEDGPRPVLLWEIPEEEELARWKDGLLVSHAKEEGGSSSLPTPFSFEWTMAQALGFFLVSAYLKEMVNNYVEINFIEEVIRWKQSKGRQRAEKTAYIVLNYLTPLAESSTEGDLTPELAVVTPDAIAPPPKSGNNMSGHGEDSGSMRKIHPIVGPPKTEITEYSLRREPTGFLPKAMEDLRARNSGPIKTCVGLGGDILESIMSKVDFMRNLPGFGSPSIVPEADNSNISGRRQSLTAMKSDVRRLSLMVSQLPENLFDDAELVVADSIREKYWAGFQTSVHHSKLLNFLWFQDRTVVEEDFFVMRVLGRGGFGLVTGMYSIHCFLIYVVL
jgi:hypothetical protein